MRILMNLKKLLWPVFCGMLALMVACSSDSTTPTDPGTPGGEGGNPGTNPSGENGGSAYVSPVALATSANKDAAMGIYNSWVGYHFVTKEAEAAYYPSVAKEYNEVFGNISPVGRIIWATQTSFYKNQCQVEDATVPAMKFRGCTVSEGIGYGMLNSYFAGDETTFNSLWNYSRGYRTYFVTKFTPWITYNFHYNKIDNSSATDADLDIATSLILMYYKTNKQEYLNDALTIVNAIWEQEIEQPSKLILSGNTNVWTINPTYNLSYFSPVALRLFAKVDGNHDWNGVITAMYAYMRKVQDAGTGVFPDWSDAAGAAKNPPNSSATNTYWLFDKESVRIPWRIAWDYYWFQDENAKAVLDKLNGFISEKSGNNPGNVDALGKSYSWNLSVGADKAGGGVISSMWLGAWCATGISGNSDWLNQCTTALNAKMPTNGPASYFQDILLTIYAQLLNGLYVRPF